MNLGASRLNPPVGWHLILVTCVGVGALVALDASWIMRRQHPVVSPHSAGVGTATLLLWLGIVAVLLLAPLIGAFRLSRLPFPVVLRVVAWLSLASAVAVALTPHARPFAIPYAGAAVSAYLFSGDALGAFRRHAWPGFAVASLGWLLSVLGFLFVSMMIFYFE